VSALVTDLARRGLLDDTLVVLCTEFGRRPFSKTNEYTKGREHHHLAFTCAMAGGGVRGGMVYGKTDDYGNLVVENAVHLHDFHATILHLMGLDHEKLTYRYAGRDFRLTDVSGKVVKDIMV
jgi:arylsulfatase A-like enzyme